MSEDPTTYRADTVSFAIRTIRGQKVILDSDLAALYGVPTKRLNEQVRRNPDRFPSDFVFQLTLKELADLKTQFVTSSSQHVDGKADSLNRSQIATGSSKHRDPRFLAYVFTEHGAIMAASVLSSPQAVQMSVFVVRAFVRMREQLLNRAETEKRLADIEKALVGHDEALRDLYRKIRPLLLPPPEPVRKQIGFHARERRVRYGKRGS